MKSIFLVFAIAFYSQMIAAQTVSLQSVSNPEMSIRHMNSLGFITKIQSDLDKKDATFTIVKGINPNCPDCISFESVNFPGSYLRHQNWRIILTPLRSDLDRNDASFRRVNGLAGTGFSFESFNFPNHFIHVLNGNVSIAAQTPDAAFGRDASFIQQGGLIKNLATGRLSAKGKHVYMNPILSNQMLSVDGVPNNQVVNLSLTVTPNLHISNSGSQVIIFDMDGSLLSDRRSQLNVNHSKSRGWFYESATVRIINSPNVLLTKVPIVKNENDGVMTSSIENSFGANLGASKEGPSGGIDASTTESKTFSRTVKGFTLDAPTKNGNIATHTIRMTGCYEGESGGLKPYNKWQDATDLDKWKSFWDGFLGVFTTGSFTGYNVYGITDAAAGKGMYLPVQAAYTSPENAKGIATFDIEVTVVLRWIRSEGHTKFDSKLLTETKQFTFRETVAVNLDMNAYGKPQ